MSSKQRKANCVPVAIMIENLFLTLHYCVREYVWNDPLAPIDDSEEVYQQRGNNQ